MPCKSFQVETGSYSAELGGAGGGQITSSLAKAAAGSTAPGYDFLRNNALDARTWNETPGTSHLVQNNFGGAVGGPLFGKKTFFFANYEGFRQIQAHTAMDTVPTNAEAIGDFSTSGATVFDPSSSHPNPNYNPALPVNTANPQTLRKSVSRTTRFRSTGSIPRPP